MIQKNKGDAEFGLMVIGFIIVLFFIWYFSGGPVREDSQKPFITPGNDQEAPLQVYGPGEKPN
jgi:hypothetical protein